MLRCSECRAPVSSDAYLARLIQGWVGFCSWGCLTRFVESAGSRIRDVAVRRLRVAS